MVLLNGCQKKAEAEKETSGSFFAMDTAMTIRYFGGDESLLQESIQMVKDIEQQVSVTLDGSTIQKLNTTGSARFQGDSLNILRRALQLCEETGGALDISVYPIVQEWGFTVNDPHVPDKNSLLNLLEHVDYRRIHLSEDGNAAIPEGMSVDLGSVTKGYAGDLLAQKLIESGVSSALMDLGGNVQAVGTKPDGSSWRIGVRAPDREGLLGVLAVSNEAVITSGGYERFFEDEDGNIWWHIMDPATGYPAQSGLISVTIVGKEGIRCDALSTALFVMGKDRAIQFWREHQDFEMILVEETGSLIITPELSSRFTPDNSVKKKITVLN